MHTDYQADDVIILKALIEDRPSHAIVGSTAYDFHIYHCMRITYIHVNTACDTGLRLHS